MSNHPKESHPSYVMVGFSRTTGGGKRTLFGSATRDHNSTIRLRVTRATVEHDLHREWYFGEVNPIIEVELSAAQFAELVSTPNVGDGVPATMLRFDGKAVPPPPDRPVEVDRIENDFEKEQKDFMRRIAAEMKEARTLLEAQGPLKVPERKRIVELLFYIERHVASNMPFAITSFIEAADRVKTAAKAEIDAFMTHVITLTGIKAIREGHGIIPKGLIEGASDDGHKHDADEPDHR